MFKSIIVRPAEDNPNDLMFTDISNFDLKGSVPARFMNMMLTTMVSKGTAKLYEQMQKV